MARQKTPRVLDANLLFAGHEPSWKDLDPEEIKKDLKLLLIKSLNWYAANATWKESDTWFKKHFPKMKPTHTMTVGYLCRMVDRGFPKDLIWSKIEEMAKKLPQEKPKKQEVQAKQIKEVTLVDKISDKVCEDIDYAIDSIILKKSVNPSFLISGFSKKQLETVKDYATNQSREYEGCSDREGYAISKRQENAIVGMLRKLLLSIDQSLPEEKVRKPRKKKEIPVEKIVKSFLVSDFGEFKTLPATKIHGATMALFYDSKYRRASLVVAESGKFLSVKGRGVINYDEAKSCSKVIRKPEEQLKDLVSSTKTNISKKLDSIRAVANKPRDRSTETTILLKVW